MRNRFLGPGFMVFLLVPFMILGGSRVPPCFPAPEPIKGGTTNTPQNAATYSFRIVHAYPHDRRAYTQGLVFDQGIFFEGTGLRGRSELRRVELISGRVMKAVKLPNRFFGEGITLYGEHLVQLTWKSHVGFVYDREGLTLVDTFKYSTEGWGITQDGTRFIMSDGTSTLYFLRPGNFELAGSIEVHDNGVPVSNINELEYVKGEVYANIWQTDRIARIDLETGRVVGWIELEGLLPLEDQIEPIDVLNGIAYDTKNDRLFVTGKLWPKIFEIELIPLH